MLCYVRNNNRSYFVECQQRVPDSSFLETTTRKLHEHWHNIATKQFPLRGPPMHLAMSVCPSVFPYGLLQGEPKIPVYFQAHHLSQFWIKKKSKSMITKWSYSAIRSMEFVFGVNTLCTKIKEVLDVLNFVIYKRTWRFYQHKQMTLLSCWSQDFLEFHRKFTLR